MLHDVDVCAHVSIAQVLGLPFFDVVLNEIQHQERCDEIQARVLTCRAIKFYCSECSQKDCPGWKALVAMR